MSDYQHEGRQRAGMSAATNLVVAAVRASGAVLTGSGALLCGAVQATADGIAQGVLTATCGRGSGAKGLHFPRHPLAQERQRNFWPLALAALLTGLGGGLVISIAATRLGRLPDFPPAYGRVGVAIAAATTLWKAAPMASPSWWHDLGQLRHSRRPDAALLALQDALSGVNGVLLTAAVTGTALTSNPRVDTLGTLAAGVVMAGGAFLHLVLMRRIVVGRGASRVEQQGITAAIEIEPSVMRLAQVDTYHLSPDELLVAAKVDLITGLDLAEVSETLQRLRASIRRAVPTVCALYLEPDARGRSEEEAETAPVMRDPEIRPAGSDFEWKLVSIPREATNQRTDQEGQPWQSA